MPTAIRSFSNRRPVPPMVVGYVHGLSTYEIKKKKTRNTVFAKQLLNINLYFLMGGYVRVG